MPPKAVDGRRDGARDLLLEANVARERERPAARRLDLGGRGVDRAFELRMRLLRLGDDGDVGAFARRTLAMARPMPRLAPVMKSVLPASPAISRRALRCGARREPAQRAPG